MILLWVAVDAGYIGDVLELKVLVFVLRSRRQTGFEDLIKSVTLEREAPVYS
jgi:hypothetical protein